MKKIFFTVPLLLSAFVSFMPQTNTMATSRAFTRFREAVAKRNAIDAADIYFDLDETEQRMAKEELKRAHLSIPGVDIEGITQSSSFAAPSIQPKPVPSTVTPSATGLSSDEVASQLEKQLTLLDRLKATNQELENKIKASKESQLQNTTLATNLETENKSLEQIIAKLTAQAQELQTQVNSSSHMTQARDARTVALLQNANTNLRKQLQDLQQRKIELEQQIATAKQK